MPDRTRTRRAAVAGHFYPAEARALSAMVAALLDSAGAAIQTRPKALIAPHAGYAYCGAVAARAFATLAAPERPVDRVIVAGPAHTRAVAGLAMSGATAFETPLGPVPVDRAAVDAACTRPGVEIDDAAHRAEHSVEVILPFLQTLLGGFALVPVLVGHDGAAALADLLDRYWNDPGTVAVISSDLSHYLDYDAARSLDAETRAAIEAGQSDLDPVHACGSAAINGLMACAHGHGLSATTLAMANSGDSTGPRDRVVGYGAWMVA